MKKRRLGNTERGKAYEIQSYVVFGFFKDSMEIREIREIYRTHNPLASTAASLDRLVIKGRRQEMMCAVCDRETLLQELKKRNPGIIWK